MPLVVSGIIADLDTNIMFATAGTLEHVNHNTTNVVDDVVRIMLQNRHTV
jgi:hypothetical protein